MKRIACGVLLAVLLISMLYSAFKILPAEATGTIYIRADGSIEPTNAPIQREGDHYSLSDDLLGFDGNGIVVQRANAVFEGLNHSLKGITDGLGGKFGITVQNENVTVMGLKITGFDIGVEGASGSFTVEDCVLINNIGIENWEGWDVRIIDNTIINSTYGRGIDCFLGIYEIVGNNFVDSGLYMQFPEGNFVSGNLVNGKPLVYLEDITDCSVKDAGQAILSNCNQIRVENLDLSHSCAVLQLWNTNSSLIKDNNIIGKPLKNQLGFYDIPDGILLAGNSNNNTITGNNLISAGLRLFKPSEPAQLQAQVEGNTVNGKPLVYLQNETSGSVGNSGQVILVNCSNVLLENLSISRTDIGLCLLSVVNCSIVGNVIDECTCGILMYYSLNNSIIDNNIRYNDLGAFDRDTYGYDTFRGNNFVCNGLEMYIWVSDGEATCWVIHNNFVNNLDRLYFMGNYLILDAGYPEGGNYWSYYTGTDLFGGPYQNETGSDGIGDEQYASWDMRYVDHFPLMGPWTNQGENVTITCANGVSLAFENVLDSGITTVEQSQSVPEPPKGFRLAGESPIYYSIATQANFSGSIHLSIPYDDKNLTEQEERNLQLMHWNDTAGEWQNITTQLDIVGNIICGETWSLSPFIVVKPFLSDINKDGIVDIFDIVIVALEFGRPPPPITDLRADINSDGIIDIFDMVVVALHFGEAG